MTPTIDHAYLSASVATLDKQVKAAEALLKQANERLFTLRGALGYARVLLATQPKPDADPAPAAPTNPVGDPAAAAPAAEQAPSN